MKVRGIVEINISPDEQKRIVREYLWDKFNWWRSYYILEGYVYCASDSSERIRKATERDKFCYELLCK